MEQQTQQQQNQTKSVIEQLREFDSGRMMNRVRKCCEQKINEILSKQDLTNEDIQMLNNLVDLYNKCGEGINKEYPYSNTKEDYEALKSAYLGNRCYENDFIMNLLLKIKMVETLLNNR